MSIDPDNLRQFAERLNIVGELLVNKAFVNAEARKAYTALLYVQSSLKLERQGNDTSRRQTAKSVGTYSKAV